jgi:hypothetical protein
MDYIIKDPWRRCIDKIKLYDDTWEDWVKNLSKEHNWARVYDEVSCPNHNKLSVWFQPWHCWRLCSEVIIGPPLSTLLQSKMLMDGARSGWCEHPLREINSKTRFNMQGYLATLWLYDHHWVVMGGYSLSLVDESNAFLKNNYKRGIPGRKWSSENKYGLKVSREKEACSDVKSKCFTYSQSSCSYLLCCRAPLLSGDLLIVIDGQWHFYLHGRTFRWGVPCDQGFQESMIEVCLWVTVWGKNALMIGRLRAASHCGRRLRGCRFSSIRL